MKYKDQGETWHLHTFPTGRTEVVVDTHGQRCQTPAYQCRWPVYLTGPGTRLPVLELTRRNLTILLAKLDDPLSARSIIDGENRIMVTAVEDDAHYSDRPAGEMILPSTGEHL